MLHLDNNEVECVTIVWGLKEETSCPTFRARYDMLPLFWMSKVWKTRCSSETCSGSHKISCCSHVHFTYSKVARGMTGAGNPTCSSESFIDFLAAIGPPFSQSGFILGHFLHSLQYNDGTPSV